MLARSGGNRLRGAAWLTFALMVIVIFASAFMRLAGPAGITGLAVEIARGAHRVSASVALVLAIFTAIVGWDRFRPLVASRVVAAALVVLGVALSFLGRFTPSTHPFVALGNPLGGLAMVGLAWWLYRAASEPRGGSGPAAPGWVLTAASFAAVAAIVVWPPALALGLAAQALATIALAVGVGILQRSAAA
jgi:hypothetical protein